MKTFPTSWRTTTKSVGDEAATKSATEHGMSFESSTSAASTGTESRTACGSLSRNVISSVSHALPRPRSTPICISTSSISPLQLKTESLSGVAVGESKTGNSPSTSVRKMKVDKRCSQTKTSITTEDDRSKSSVAHDRNGNRRSEEECMRPESSAEIVGSSLNTSATSEPGAKPRIKLKIGSGVVAKTYFSPRKQSFVVSTSDKMYGGVCNGNGLPEQCSVPNVCVNGDPSEKLNLLNANSCAERMGHASSNGSSYEEDSVSEPVSKHARMSFEQHCSSTVENSASRRIRHD